jgi:hypothetical protein
MMVMRIVLAQTHVELTDTLGVTDRLNGCTQRFDKFGRLMNPNQIQLR